MTNTDGHALLAGLTDEEAAEFEVLDRCAPFGDELVWPKGGFPIGGFPGSASEQRWLELWSKHRRAVNDQPDEQDRVLLWW
jgi:hypothetical protein